MIYNDIPKMLKANLCFVFFRQQSDDYLKKNGIVKCKKCKGLGLDQVRKFDGSYMWDGSSYCEECGGVGYKGVKDGLQIDLLHYICKSCAGLGCNSCNKGVVDWIDHSMGR